MPYGRARFASKLIHSHTGTGRVIAPINMMGKSLSLRKAIIRKVGFKGCEKTKNCYISKQMMGEIFKQ